MGVPRAQLRGQPGVTIRNVSSFTTVQEAHATAAADVCVFCLQEMHGRERSDEL